MDLDVECLQNSETIFEEYDQPGRQLYIGRMGTDDTHRASLPNAWFASTPGHPFWILPLEFAQANIDEIDTAEGLFGLGACFDIVQQYDTSYKGPKVDNHYVQSDWRQLYPRLEQSVSEGLQHTITILPHWVIYPYSWLKDGLPYQPFC